MEFLLYFIAGAGAGVLSGLLGVGGGTVIVPILVVIFTSLAFPPQHIMHIALGTSLATIIVTSISSARAHHKKQNVHWSAVKLIAPGIVIGTLLGAVLAGQLDTVILKVIFAVFVLLIATQMVLNFTPAAHRQLPSKAGTLGMGGVIGVLSSLVGIGGGSLSVPFLIYCNFNARYAIGTSSAIGLPIAVAGTLGFVVTGLAEGNLPAYSLGYVYLPAFAGIALASMLTAPFGAYLAHRLPVPVLKKLFALLLYVVGIKMLWSLV
ncbi:sulfite exporter TauE/SafE family protein [Methylobacillus flagellatus]|uniref:sulfite exporter TauE/SafE family protein n=1 Tax=Methylobacillus flagellatus TaxID=405 RepID=UPI002853D8B2|nr:sulfite exporter TauE/SafE family protein [Methylobacillus flagellatus]MDR5172380.1 sulfite exporter TauE/SafE family protein [Methylobacillus flagellatus]